MECKEIRELAELMIEMGLSVLDYKENDTSIRMERATTATPADSTIPASTVIADRSHNEQKSAGEYIVKSPMVGLFYSAPGTDKEPYVKTGDPVREGDILCIIEAMKIMNEITAEHDGIVAEIYAENKQIVEFNQPLFRIERS